MVSASQILNASILVVDDQEANVMLLERMLRGAGYASIASTMDPHEVCELQRHHRYSLILLGPPEHIWTVRALASVIHSPLFVEGADSGVTLACE